MQMSLVSQPTQLISDSGKRKFLSSKLLMLNSLKNDTRASYLFNLQLFYIWQIGLRFTSSQHFDTEFPLCAAWEIPCS